jgi:hypothetical protein
MRALGICLTFFLLAAGCTTTHSYDVLVTNNLQEPVTVWLTKQHGPWGDGWYPPEEVAMETTGTTPINGRVIPPGQTGEAKASGQFSSDNQAILRVYRSVDLNQMMAMDRGDPGRVDQPLTPGKSDLDIDLVNGAITAQPHGH